MPGKDDPLGQRPSPRVLWLGKENMAEARDNYYRAFATIQGIDGSQDEQRIWDLAWAAAIAAFSYIQEGRTEPR